MDLFRAVKDGILICKLINASIKGTIDERAINKGANLNTFKITENQNLCINSAKAIGCTVVNVGAGDLTEGKVHLVLGLIWQIIRIGLLASINLKNHPYLVRLLEPGETLEDLLKLSPEQILIRWVNYHLKNAGSNRRIANFGNDIKDSEVYTLLLNQLAPKKCDKNALSESNVNKRAEMVLNNAAKIDCKKFVRPRDIVAGNPKLNLAFVANMFNTCPGLEPVEEQEVVIDEETREEKAFRNWMNSLGVDPFVNNLYEDLRDGLILLQILDKIEPGIVDWNKVNKTKPLNKFKQVENCNYAVVLGKQLKFSLVGVAGSDIQAGNKKLTLAVVWQAMRYFVLTFLKKMSKNGREITDTDIIQWCNQQVRGAGKSRTMESFKDKSLSDSLFIMDLLWACQPDSVNFDLVNAGKTDEEKMLNAQYAVSCARKMGCAVFCLWEDIVEVKDKMMLTFFGSIMGQFGNR
jgi:plastin-1